MSTWKVIGLILGAVGIFGGIMAKNWGAAIWATAYVVQTALNIK